MLIFEQNFTREFLFVRRQCDGTAIFTGTSTRRFILDELVVVPIDFQRRMLEAIKRLERLNVNVRLADEKWVVVELDEDVNDGE